MNMIWQLQDRGKCCWLVLIPGWGFDAEVFADLDLPYNYLLASWEALAEFPEQLADSLRTSSTDRYSILGWSLGACLAVEFARAYPQLVSNLHLVSACQTFSAEEIQRERESLCADPKQHLTQFYRRVFLGQKKDWQWFENTLLNKYLNHYSLEDLVRGLEYLAERRLDLEGLPPTTVWQGDRDRFASPELLKIVERSSTAKLNMLPGLGHVPFVDSHFQKAWLGQS